MVLKWQFSLLQLLLVVTACALTLGLPFAFASRSEIATMVALLLWLAATGAAIGGAFGRVADGLLAGTCLWEFVLIVGLLLLV